MPINERDREREKEKEIERERKREREREREGGREGEWNFWPSVACRKELCMTTTSFEAEKITS